jgi:hypothetical protein
LRRAARTTTPIDFSRLIFAGPRLPHPFLARGECLAVSVLRNVRKSG